MRKKILVVFLVVFIMFFIFDNTRDPEYQISTSFYKSSIESYQNYISPRLDGFVSCRFRPTCSAYSYQSVETYGFVKGFGMTLERLSRCNSLFGEDVDEEDLPIDDPVESTSQDES